MADRGVGNVKRPFVSGIRHFKEVERRVDAAQTPFEMRVARNKPACLINKPACLKNKQGCLFLKQGYFEL